MQVGILHRWMTKESHLDFVLESDLGATMLLKFRYADRCRGLAHRRTCTNRNQTVLPRIGRNGDEAVRLQRRANIVLMNSAAIFFCYLNRQKNVPNSA